MFFGRGFPAFGGLAELFVLAALVIQIVLHLALAQGVFQLASRRVVRGQRLWFIGAGMWAFATLAGGMLTAVAYWVMHHSNLVAVETVDDTE